MAAFGQGSSTMLRKLYVQSGVSWGEELADGFRKSHLMCALCGHTPPGLADSCFRDISLSFWKTAISMLCLPSGKPRCSPATPHWVPSGQPHPCCCGLCEWSSHLCSPALGHPPQILPSRCTDPWPEGREHEPVGRSTEPPLGQEEGHECSKAVHAHKSLLPDLLLPWAAPTPVLNWRLLPSCFLWPDLLGQPHLPTLPASHRPSGFSTPDLLFFAPLCPDPNTPLSPYPYPMPPSP